jgi:Fe2+ or Zn2+ uptake regulation protein
MIIIIGMEDIGKETILNANTQAVLDVLRATDQHPTALEIYEEVKHERPRIGLATIYRILHQLTQQGVIKAIGENESRYDAHIQRHDHAVCTRCGALLDVPMDIYLAHESLQAAARAAGIELYSHEVRLYGLCAACQHKI